MKIQKVLIVDNNITIVELVGSLLEHSGFEVMKAYGGMEAFELLENTDDLPDTIILDLVMP